LLVAIANWVLIPVSTEKARAMLKDVCRIVLLPRFSKAIGDVTATITLSEGVLTG
jgi:hypothetical protein